MMTGLEYEVGLIIPVPEAEALVASYREKYDPAAAKGVPAHITINYPFRDYHPGQHAVLDALRDLFGRYSSFQFSLATIQGFPYVLYLAPEPEQPFIDLARAVVAAYPDSPPYDGKFETIIPHLTFAESDDIEQLQFIKQEFSQDASQMLPIKCQADSIWLMDNYDGVWKKRAEFPLRV